MSDNKKLKIKILTEKLEKETGKKVVLKESDLSDSNFKKIVLGLIQQLNYNKNFIFKKEENFNDGITFVFNINDTEGFNKPKAKKEIRLKLKSLFKKDFDVYTEEYKNSFSINIDKKDEETNEEYRFEKEFPFRISLTNHPELDETLRKYYQLEKHEKDSKSESIGVQYILILAYNQDKSIGYYHYNQRFSSFDKTLIGFKDRAEYLKCKKLINQIMSKEK